MLGEGNEHKATLYVHLQRFGDAVPRYNVFGEFVNRIKINQEAYFAQNPEAAAQIEEIRRQEALEAEKNDEPLESLPNFQPLQMAEFFRVFVQRIGPLVSAWDVIYNLMTIKDTRDTVTFLSIMSYVIVYQE